MTAVGGLDLGSMFNNVSSSLKTDGENLQKKIDSLSQNKGSLNQQDLLEMQFAMGQYNAKMEALSSITKSLQDMLKSLAQRTG